MARQGSTASASRALDRATLERDLQRAKVLDAAGKYAAGLELATTVRQRAEAIQDAELLVRAAAVQGRLALGAGDLALAESSLRYALTEGAALGLDEVAADAGSALLFAMGERGVDTDEALVWAEMTRTSLRRLGATADQRGAVFLGALGSLHEARGEYEEAKRDGENALAIQRAELGEDHPLSRDRVEQPRHRRLALGGAGRGRTGARARARDSPACAR